MQLYQPAEAAVEHFLICFEPENQEFGLCLSIDPDRNYFGFSAALAGELNLHAVYHAAADPEIYVDIDEALLSDEIKPLLTELQRDITDLMQDITDLVKQ